MDKLKWQKHTVRGFMAGAMKKADFSVYCGRLGAAGTAFS
jgi:hypothetical protein